MPDLTVIRRKKCISAMMTMRKLDIAALEHAYKKG